MNDLSSDEELERQDDSLYGKFATPGITWDNAELDAFLHEAGTEWELELDQLSDSASTIDK